MRRRDLILTAAALAACSQPQEKEETPPADGARAVTDPAAIIRPLYDPYLTEGAQFPSLREQAPWSNGMGRCSKQ